MENIKVEIKRTHSEIPDGEAYNQNKQPFVAETMGIGYVSPHGIKLRKDAAKICVAVISAVEQEYSNAETIFLMDEMSSLISGYVIDNSVNCSDDERGDNEDQIQLNKIQ